MHVVRRLGETPTARGDTPPDWVLAGARRLSSEEFSTEFVTAWSHIGSSFLKLECWQAYEEAEANLSQEAYRRGDVAAARDLLKQEAERDRPLYEDVQQRGIEYARVRLVKEPLSSYLEYELISYEIRAALGENVEVVRIGGDEQLPSAEYFDFLLFDQHTAIIHDYGTGSVGRQTGGWVTHEAEVVAALHQKGAELRRHSTPFRQYLAGLVSQSGDGIGCWSNQLRPQTPGDGLVNRAKQTIHHR